MSSTQEAPLRLTTPPASKGGKLTASILSAYDLPNSTTETSSINDCYVSMCILGQEVKTGPPSAKHKEKNSFKFVDVGSNGSESVGANELVVTAPLSMLYPATATFHVVCGDSQQLTATCELSTVLHINETQWLILNLEPAESSKDATPVDEEHPPTLRLKLTLSGPHRQEIATIISISNAWFGMMDTFTSATSKTFSSLTTHLPNRAPLIKYLLLPSVPFAAGAVVFLPVIAGVLILGLPFLLPLLVLLFSVALTAGLIGSTIYISSSNGRESASHILQPVYSSFESTNAGQRLMYDTGPRPSPVALAGTILPDDMMSKLFVSLCIDFIGSSSYLIPGVGEAFDLTWAPIQTILLMAMYDSKMPSLKYISFLEEILPFTDVTPSATIGWAGEYGPAVMSEGIKKAGEMGIVLRAEGDALKFGVKS